MTQYMFYINVNLLWRLYKQVIVADAFITVVITETVPPEQPEVKCLAQRHNGDRSWITYCGSQNCNLFNISPDL